MLLLGGGGGDVRAPGCPEDADRWCTVHGGICHTIALFILLLQKTTVDAEVSPQGTREKSRECSFHTKNQVNSELRRRSLI